MDSTLSSWAERIRAAATQGTALRVRGGGSKGFFGGAVAGDWLDTREYQGIVSYEPSELVVTARCGTPLAELEAVLAERGQCLAFEPPHFGPADSATVGGMVAAGLSGPSRASVGGVRDFVLGAQLINGRGELLQFGGQVMKNVAGYDLSRVLAASWGTLGIITQVSLKVLPLAPAEATLVFELDQARALAQLHTWGGQPLPLNASCWVRDNNGPSARDLLFVRLRGAVAAVDAATRDLLQRTPGEHIDNAQAAPDWQACRDLRLPFFARTATADLALWRLSVAQTAPVLDLPWPQLVEWHGAQRWLWAPLSAASALQQAAAQAGGHATLFIAPSTPLAGAFAGDGAAPTPANASSVAPWATLPEPMARIQRQLKAEFDPAGVFNPGRLWPAAPRV